MIMGDVCTRACGYCNVTHGAPHAARTSTSRDKLAEAVDAMELAYVVVTSVDRDDLPDFGAAHFAAHDSRDKARMPECRVEVLIPDFQGDEAPLRTVLDARPDVLNHNIETVPRLYRMARPGGRYSRALTCSTRATRRAGHPDEDRPHGRPRRGVRRGRRRRSAICARSAARSSPSASTCARRWPTCQ